MSDPLSLAFFISPHGYGHAARASAVMSAVHGIDPTIRFDIFTTVPEWFFIESLTGPYQYFSAPTDVGLVQTTPLDQDMTETLSRLNRYLPFDAVLVERLSEKICSLSCRMVLCDVSPLGIAVAKRAGVPSVLIENFTWDWIYEHYIDSHPEMGCHVDYMRQVFADTDVHIQTEPVCRTDSADLQTGPVSRKSRTAAHEIREKLEIPDGAKVVTVTMGGIRGIYNFQELFRRLDAATVIIPGSADTFINKGNLRLLPHHSGFYHPDMIHASDAVIGKVGYSTLAETYSAGLPMGYIPRLNFRESPVLEAFIRFHMNGIEFSEAAFHSGRWLNRTEELMSRSRMKRDKGHGADDIAAFIVERLV